jgi:4-hydroxybenzoate polyprenyltransferase
MKAKTLLELGRVSNLPTVWSNVLCGGALSGAALALLPLAVAGLSGSFFYVGGMFLNDAFDAEIDARERPERPIPSGRATRREVTALGAGLLLAGVLLLAGGAAFGLTPAGALWPLAGLATALAVVLYDRFHKGVVWSPLVMGACRAGLYLLGALALVRVPTSFTLAAAAALLLYVVGLTHIARFETASAVGRLWPTAFLFVPLALTLGSAKSSAEFEPIAVLALVASTAWTLRALSFARRGGKQIGTAVVSLIAGISLVDALFAAFSGARAVAAISLLLALLTLAGQKKIRGT